MKLIHYFFVLWTGVSMATVAVLAQPNLRKCDNDMSGLTACMATNTCFNCLSSQSQGTPGISDPANNICYSYVCPVLQEQSCCPPCESQALAMRACIVDVASVEAGGSADICSCGMVSGESEGETSEEEGATEEPGESGENQGEPSEEEEGLSEEEEASEGGGGSDEDPAENPDPAQTETPEPIDPPVEFPDICSSAAELYDQCTLSDGLDCIPCESIGMDLTNVVIGNSDCQSLSDEICNASDCCCADELKLMAQCALLEAASPCQISDCGDQAMPEPKPENPNDNNSGDSTVQDPNESNGESESPEFEQGQSDDEPDNAGVPGESEDCSSSAEKYYRCIIAEGADCLSCEAAITDLSSVTSGADKCEDLSRKVCNAKQCCCVEALEFAVQCSLREAASSCQIGNCDNASWPEDTPTGEGPGGGETGDDSTEAESEETPEESSGDPEPEQPVDPEEPGTPDEPVDPCTNAATYYDQCVLNEGSACFSCLAAITDITFIAAGMSECQRLNEQVLAQATCCCGPQLKEMTTCSLREAGSTCRIDDFDGSIPPEDPTPEIPSENEPEEPQEQTCSDLAVSYEQCLSAEQCFSCVDQAAVLSSRSFSAGSASCRAVHEVVCPATECCCSSELVALTECSHLEEHGVACDIDCDRFNATDGDDESGETDDPKDPPAPIMPDKCGDAAALYDLCVKTAKCSSCQTKDAIARTTLMALGKGRSDYSCGTINGMICPAIECCCRQELTDLTECTLEANYETCSVDCDGDQTDLATEESGDGDEQQNRPASSSPSRWREAEARIYGPGALLFCLSWFFAW